MPALPRYRAHRQITGRDLNLIIDTIEAGFGDFSNTSGGATPGGSGGGGGASLVTSVKGGSGILALPTTGDVNLYENAPNVRGTFRIWRTAPLTWAPPDGIDLSLLPDNRVYTRPKISLDTYLDNGICNPGTKICQSDGFFLMQGAVSFNVTGQYDSIYNYPFFQQADYSGTNNPIPNIPLQFTRFSNFPNDEFTVTVSYVHDTVSSGVKYVGAWQGLQNTPQINQLGLVEHVPSGTSYTLGFSGAVFMPAGYDFGSSFIIRVNSLSASIVPGPTNFYMLYMKIADSGSVRFRTQLF